MDVARKPCRLKISAETVSTRARCASARVVVVTHNRVLSTDWSVEYREPAMSWELSEEHLAFRATCKAFVDREIRPLVPEAEATKTFPRDLMKRMGAAGLLGLVTPEEFGGAGNDSLAVAILSEELARASGGIAVTALVSAYMA